jgi:hypothetical protein
VRDSTAATATTSATAATTTTATTSCCERFKLSALALNLFYEKEKCTEVKLSIKQTAINTTINKNLQ